VLFSFLGTGELSDDTSGIAGCESKTRTGLNSLQVLSSDTLKLSLRLSSAYSDFVTGLKERGR